MSGAPRPVETPLHMPEQPLEWSLHQLRSNGRSHFWRKICVGSLSVILTAWLAWMMYRVLNVSGVTPLEWGLLALFIVNIGWIGFAFVSACIGFLSCLFDTPDEQGGEKELTSRTAILFPIYNESVVDVFATVEATATALAEAAPDRFECFILSDTTSPEIALEEETAFQRLRDSVKAGSEVWYRRRTINVARKAGNIHDFVSRWGGRYDQLVIFDADSYMSAATLVELVRRMEARPEVGLIQTVPKLIGGKSVFARVQQFAASVYGPLLARGIAWWAQNEGNYWGHNAIIRTKAFADAAGLPVMPGRAPFGGHILSHDFVEAALLRRAGWKVLIAPEMGGSFEEGPQTIIDLTIRDRRWCQGNLQHSAVLARARGITLTNRLHFMIGIFSYLASPLWLVLILVGMALSLQNRFLRPEYFAGQPTLTPSWPVIDPALALSVFGFTMAILLLPKLFGVVLAIVRPGPVRKRRPVQVLSGAIGETVMSALVAPILMAAQTSSVVSILTGQDAGWTPQQRGSDGYRFKDVSRRHALTSLLGLVLTGAALAISPVFAAWLAPATLGMIFAAPLSYALGKQVPDESWTGRLLATQESRETPVSFASSVEARSNYADLQPPSIEAMMADRQLFRRHRTLVDQHWPLNDDEIHVPLATAVARASKAETLEAYLSALSKPELMALLNSPTSLARVRRHYMPEATDALIDATP